MMSTSIHIRTRVLPGQKIEFVASDFAEGDDVEVVLTRAENSRQISALEIIESLNGQRIHANAAEVSARLSEERDSWDR